MIWIYVKTVYALSLSLPVFSDTRWNIPHDHHMSDVVCCTSSAIVKCNENIHGHYDSGHELCRRNVLSRYSTHKHSTSLTVLHKQALHTTRFIYTTDIFRESPFTWNAIDGLHEPHMHNIPSPSKKCHMHIFYMSNDLAQELFVCTV